MSKRTRIIRVCVQDIGVFRNELMKVNHAITEGQQVTDMRIDDTTAGWTYLDVTLKKPERSREIFDAGFSSKAKSGKVRARRPLQCIDRDGPCTQAHARKMGKDCHGCGG